MSETKHTPGPWRIWSSGVLGRGKQFIHAGKGESPCLDKSFRCVAAIGELEMTPEESEANARLISAAPELLEALELCVKRMAELQEHTSYPLAWPRVVAMEAIAKAKGTK